MLCSVSYPARYNGNIDVLAELRSEAAVVNSFKPEQPSIVYTSITPFYVPSEPRRVENDPIIADLDGLAGPVGMNSAHEEVQQLITNFHSFGIARGYGDTGIRCVASTMSSVKRDHRSGSFGVKYMVQGVFCFAKYVMGEVLGWCMSLVSSSLAGSDDHLVLDIRNRRIEQELYHQLDMAAPAQPILTQPKGRRLYTIDEQAIATPSRAGRSHHIKRRHGRR